MILSTSHCVIKNTLNDKNRLKLELLTQPGAGIAPLLAGIEKARHTLQIVIFRFDRGEIEAALVRAARRGVFVHALVAYTSTGQGGERTLRNLEARLLGDGVSVARTATDLVRYHDKLMIVDKKILYMLGFNYTYLDIERSRSFGLVTEEKQWVQEAEKLFLADATRQNYTPGCDTFLVSPGNSRRHLTTFILHAKRQLLIYDGKLSDPTMMRLLMQKAQEGVEIRVIGKAGRHSHNIKVAPLDMRLHAQAIVRDAEALYLGSQSLRTLELDARREVGVILSDTVIAGKVLQTFESDWARIKNGPDVPLTQAEIAVEDPIEDTAEDLSLLTPSMGSGVNADGLLTSPGLVKTALKDAIKDVLLESMPSSPESKILKEMVKEAAKEALREMKETTG